MNKNEIIQIQGMEYKEMTKQLLNECALATLIPSKVSLIGIKPNLVAPVPAEFGGTTHPEVVAGIIEYLQENGFTNLQIMEGSWVGDKTEESFEVCGYRMLSEQYGVPLIDAQKEKSMPVQCGDMELQICECAKKVDFMINVPVMKGHCQTKITCALKNMKGLLPNVIFMPWDFIGQLRIWGLGFIRILFWWIISAETLTLRMAVIRLL